MDAPIPREALEARIEPSQPDDAAPDLPHIAAGHPYNRPLHGLDNFTLTFSLDNGVAEGVVGAL